jgi:hypothetical protein
MNKKVKNLDQFVGIFMLTGLGAIPVAYGIYPLATAHAVLTLGLLIYILCRYFDAFFARKVYGRWMAFYLAFLAILSVSFFIIGFLNRAGAF